MTTAISKATTAFNTINDNFTYLDNRIDGISGTAKMFTTLNPAITPNNGIASWSIQHNLNTQNVIVSLFKGTNEIVKNVAIDSVNAVTVEFFANETVAAESHKIVVMGV